MSRVFWRYIRHYLGNYLYSFLSAPLVLRQLKRKLRLDHYDLVFFHRFDHFGFCALPKSSIIFVRIALFRSIFDPGDGVSRLPPPWAARRMISKALKNRKIFTVSEGVKKDLEENFGVPEGNVACVYNPIDVDRIESLARQAPEQPVPERYIIAVGRVAGQKRFDLLIRAYARSKIEEDLVFLGTGYGVRALKNIVSELGVRHKVHFFGFQRNPYPYVRKARLLVCSSDYEGLPNTVAEAIACGTPVVTTDCPHGPREILRGDMQKWLVPVGDEKALSDKIREVLKEKPAVDKTVLERFRPERVCRRYLEEAERLLHASPDGKRL